MKTSSRYIGLGLIFLLLAAFPLIAPLFGLEFYIGFVRRVLVVALAAASLNFILGFGGMVALGHAGFIGMGAYTVVALSDAGVMSAWIMWPAAALVAGLVAALIGTVALRTRGVYFIMVTLAFAQMAFFVFHDTKIGGGSDGIYMYVRPAIGALDMENRTVLFYVVLASLVFTYGLLALVRRSRFGAALAGIRVNEQRMRAAGFAVYGYKLAAFVLAGALAGLAGFLLASRDGVVNPELMAWHNSGEVLLMVILGGLGHLRGAVIGAIAFTLLKEIFSTHAVMGPLADHWQLTLGIAIIVFVAWLPKGLIGLVKRLSPKETA